jgi:hypothetical protein
MQPLLSNVLRSKRQVVLKCCMNIKFSQKLLTSVFGPPDFPLSQTLPSIFVGEAAFAIGAAATAASTLNAEEHTSRLLVSFGPRLQCGCTML